MERLTARMAQQVAQLGGGRQAEQPQQTAQPTQPGEAGQVEEPIMSSTDATVPFDQAAYQKLLSRPGTPYEIS